MKLLERMFGPRLAVYEWTCSRCAIQSEPFLTEEEREADVAAHVFEYHPEQ